MVEAYRRDATSKDQLIGELKATKRKLDTEVQELRRELVQLRGDNASLEAERSHLHKEASQVQQQMATLQQQLESAQKERDEMETRLQVRAGRGGATQVGGASLAGEGAGPTQKAMVTWCEVAQHPRCNTARAEWAGMGGHPAAGIGPRTSCVVGADEGHRAGSGSMCNVRALWGGVQCGAGAW